VQGVGLIYGGQTDEQPLKVEFGVTDGENSKNTNFTNSGINYGGYVRADYKFSGKWSEHATFQNRDTENTLMVLGGGITLTDRDDITIFRSTVDFQYENPNGFGLFVAGIYNFAEDRGADTGDQYGAVVAANYLFTKNCDGFVRGSWIHFDEFNGSDDDDFYEISVGGSYYFGPDGKFVNRAKIVLDLSWLPEGSPSEQTGFGAFASDSDQFIAKVQFQLTI
jgi:predicted small secreted protein